MSVSFWGAEYTKLNFTCSACALHHQAPALAMNVPASFFVCILFPLRTTDTYTRMRPHATDTKLIYSASGECLRACACQTLRALKASKVCQDPHNALFYCMLLNATGQCRDASRRIQAPGTQAWVDTFWAWGGMQELIESASIRTCCLQCLQSGSREMHRKELAWGC